jgi:hypothetical protein
LITQVTTFPKRNNRISAFVFNPSGQFCEIYQSLAGEAACRDAVRSVLPSACRQKRGCIIAYDAASWNEFFSLESKE